LERSCIANILVQIQRLAPPRQAESCAVELELTCLEVLSKCAAKLDKLKALDCVVEKAGEGDDTNNETGCLCHVELLE
jgi:hypothetical protein